MIVFFLLLKVANEFRLRLILYFDSRKKSSCLYLASKFFPDECQPKVEEKNGSEDETEEVTEDEEVEPPSSPEEDFLSNHAVCMCDDDNDLEMALACQHAYLPDVSSESMRDTIAEFPDHFTTTFSRIEESEDDDSAVSVEETDASDLALSMIWTRTTKELDTAPVKRYRLTKRKISVALCFAMLFAIHTHNDNSDDA